jgi:hypothetical protein
MESEHKIKMRLKQPLKQEVWDLHLPAEYHALRRDAAARELYEKYRDLMMEYLDMWNSPPWDHAEPLRQRVWSRLAEWVSDEKLLKGTARQQSI